MFNKKVLTISIVVFVCMVIVISLYCYNALAGDNRFEGRVFRIFQVIDGDTMKVRGDNANFVVRALGIDTPESVHPDRPVECFGVEASDKAKELLLDREVRLEFSPKRERKDRYGRYLVYIYRDDGLFFNQYMLEHGYAEEYTIGKPYSKQKDFRSFESEAKRGEKGLWKCPISE